MGECVLIICVGVSADRRMTMREGEASRKMRLAGLSGGNGEGGCEGGEGGGGKEDDAGMKVTGCLRAQRGNCIHQKKSERKRRRWPGKRVTEKRRESCHSPSTPTHPPHPPTPPAASFPSARLAVLAIPCSGEERLLKPSPGSRVRTHSLLLPR